MHLNKKIKSIKILFIALFNKNWLETNSKISQASCQSIKLMYCF